VSAEVYTEEDAASYVKKVSLLCWFLSNSTVIIVNIYDKFNILCCKQSFINIVLTEQLPNVAYQKVSFLLQMCGNNV